MPLLIATDTAGREWQVVINVGTLRRIRERLDVDLMSLVEKHNNLIERLASDVVLVCDLIYVIVMDQATNLGVNDEQFGQAHDDHVDQIADKRYVAGSRGL